MLAVYPNAIICMTSHNARQVTRHLQDPGQRGGRAVSSGTRRRRLMEWMRGASGPVPGSDLARHFRREPAMPGAGRGHSARGRRGDSFHAARLSAAERASAAHRAMIACQHAPERTEEELQHSGGSRRARSRRGGRTSAVRRVARRADDRVARRRAGFSATWRGTKATLLSSLTRGVHLHTVEAQQAGDDRARQGATPASAGSC